MNKWHLLAVCFYIYMGSAHAERSPFSYTYLGIGPSVVTYDESINLSGELFEELSGTQLDASYQLNDYFFVAATGKQYEEKISDINFLQNELTASIGISWAVDRRADIVVSVGAGNIDREICDDKNCNTVDEGIEIRHLGARVLITKNIELNPSITSYKFGDSGTSSTSIIGLAYNFTKAHGLRADFGSYDNNDKIFLTSYRLSF